MAAVTLMARALQREMFDRGVRDFPLHDCEAIMSRVLERSAAEAALARGPFDFAREAAESRARAIEAAIIRFRDCGVEIERFSIQEHPHGVTHLCVDGVSRLTFQIRWPAGERHRE